MANIIKAICFRLNDHGQGPELLRQVFLERGWIEFDEEEQDDSDWNIWWRTSRFRVSDYDQIMSWQRLNHYPKSTGITKKDCLARHMKRMKGVHGAGVYNFSPAAFNVPNDYTRFVAEYGKLKQQHDNKTLLWICKPADLSRGRGIFIFRDISELQYDCNAVVQRYISNPFLIGGYKFDLRIYVAVPSFHPLSVYIYQEGIVRFGTEKFDLDCLQNIFAHLTNFSINKNSPGYLTDKDRIGTGCKWTITQLRYYFHQNNIDDRLLWHRIVHILILTLLIQAPQVPKVNNCFELYGFDILIDENLKPWLLEVNFSPAMGAECQADVIVKKPMVHDLMQMMNFKDADMDRGGSKIKSFGKAGGDGTDRSTSLSRLSRRSSSLQRLPSTFQRGLTKQPLLVKETRSYIEQDGEKTSQEKIEDKLCYGLPLVHPSDDEKRASSSSSGHSSASSDKLKSIQESDVTESNITSKDPTIPADPNADSSAELRGATKEGKNLEKETREADEKQTSGKGEGRHTPGRADGKKTPKKVEEGDNLGKTYGRQTPAGLNGKPISVQNEGRRTPGKNDSKQASRKIDGKVTPGRSDGKSVPESTDGKLLPGLVEEKQTTDSKEMRGKSPIIHSTLGPIPTTLDRSLTSGTMSSVVRRPDGSQKLVEKAYSIKSGGNSDSAISSYSGSSGSSDRLIRLDSVLENKGNQETKKKPTASNLVGLHKSSLDKNTNSQEEQPFQIKSLQPTGNSDSLRKLSRGLSPSFSNASRGRFRGGGFGDSRSHHSLQSSGQGRISVHNSDTDLKRRGKSQLFVSNSSSPISKRPNRMQERDGNLPRRNVTLASRSMQRNRTHLLANSKPKLKCPPPRIGEYFLVFPFSDATLRAAHGTLDPHVVIRESQKAIKEVINSINAEKNGSEKRPSGLLPYGSAEDGERLWAAVKPEPEAS